MLDYTYCHAGSLLLQRVSFIYVAQYHISQICMKGLHTVYSMTPSTLRPLTWVRKTPPKTPSNDEEMDDTSGSNATGVMCTDQNNTVKIQYDDKSRNR